MADDQIKTIKKLKKSIKKVEFNLHKLKNNEKPFNINKHRRKQKKEAETAKKNEIINEKIRDGFEKIVTFIQTQFPTNS